MPEATPQTTLPGRLGPLIAWVGAIGVGLMAVLAALHLGADLLDVLGALPGGRASLVAVLLTVLAIAAALAAIVLVARLSAGEGRSLRLAIVIGFATLLVVRILVAGMYDGVGDGELRQYDEVARGVLSGACCFSDRPMGYPMVLAVAYGLLGAGQAPVELLNIAFALVTGVLLLALATRGYGARVGAMSLFLYALWPAGALMIVTSLPHTFYELAITAAAWSVIATRPGWRGSALAGVILGLSQYLRPSTPILLPFVLLARAWPGEPWRRFLGGTLVPLVGLFLLVLVPVVADNAAQHGELSISTSAYGGHGLWIGTDQATGGRFSQEVSDQVLALPGKDFWQQSELAGVLAMERIKADPVGTLLLGIRKQDTLWGTERYGVQYAIRRASADDPAKPSATLPSVTSSTFWVLIIGGAAVGLFLRRRRADAFMVLVVGLLIAVSATHFLLEVRDRYHAFVVPLLLPLAAVAIGAFLERIGLLRPPVERSIEPPRTGPDVVPAIEVGWVGVRTAGHEPDGPSLRLVLVHTWDVRFRSLPCPAN